MKLRRHLPLFLITLALLSSVNAFADEGDWVRVGPAGAWQPTVAGTIFKGQLYTAENNGGLYRTNLLTGEWQQIGNADFANTVRMYAAGDSLYTIETDGSLYRVNPIDGSWAQVGPGGEWKATIAGTIFNGALYTAEDNGGLYRTNLDTGEWTQIGQNEFGSTMQMFASGDMLYTIETDGSLYRVNPNDGTWAQVGASGAWQPTLAGTILDHWLYTTENNGGLYRTNLDTGDWQQLGQPEFGSTHFMFAMGPDLYTIETDGSLYRVAVTSPGGE
jgi:hypothetical protein